MKQPRKNSILAFAILLACVSVPMNWVRIKDAPVDSDFMVGVTFSGDLNAVQGKLRIANIPMWVLPLAAVFAAILQLMAATTFFDVPRIYCWVLSVAASLGMTYAVLSPLFSSYAQAGTGSLIGLLSAAICLLMLIVRTKPDAS